MRRKVGRGGRRDKEKGGTRENEQRGGSGEEERERKKKLYNKLKIKK